MKILYTIKKRKFSWLDHTLRRTVNNISRQALDCNLQGSRRRGRPRITSRRQKLGRDEAVGAKSCTMEGICCSPTSAKSIKSRKNEAYFKAASLNVKLVQSQSFKNEACLLFKNEACLNVWMKMQDIH